MMRGYLIQRPGLIVNPVKVGPCLDRRVELVNRFAVNLGNSFVLQSMCQPRLC